MGGLIRKSNRPATTRFQKDEAMKKNTGHL